MTIEHLLAFNIALFAAIMSPGPALLAALHSTLSAGRNTGIATGCGLGLMAAIWTLMALLGLEAVFSFIPWAYTFVKIAGALYLIYIAYNIWMGAKKPIEPQSQPTQYAFRNGFLINLLNPKAVIFAAAVLIVIFPPNMGAIDNTVIVLNHLMVEMIFYTLLAIGMSLQSVNRKYLRTRTYIDRTLSVVLGALGLKILLSR